MEPFRQDLPHLLWSLPLEYWMMFVSDRLTDDGFAFLNCSSVVFDLCGERGVDSLGGEV